MLIIMIVAHLDIFEYGNSIVGESCQRKVLREQIGGDTKLIESHQTG